MPDTAAKRAEFSKWALPHMDLVYSTSLYLSRDRAEAEDLLQETYLRAYRFWHQFTPGTNCKAWLLTILHNTFRNRYRDRYRQQRTVDVADLEGTSAEADLADPSDNPEQRVFAQLLDGEVDDALRRLPAEYLEVILLVDLQELSYEEAATVLNCPIGTIRSRLSRGRRQLQQMLHGYAVERGYLRKS